MSLIKVTYFDAANKLKQEGKFEEAIASYSSAIKENPNFYWSYLNLGDVLLKVGRWEQAVNAYSRAIELNSSSAWLYYNQGEALTKLGRLDEAIACYEQAIKLAPDEMEIQSSLAEALRQRTQRDLDQAVATYQRVVELNPESVEAYQNLLKLQPHNWEMWWQLANLYSKQNQREKAIAAYQQVISLNPEYLVAYEKLTQLQPSSWENWLLFSEKLEGQGEREKAIAAYQQVISLNPNHIKSKQKLRQIQQQKWYQWFDIDTLSQIEAYKALALGVEYLAGTEVKGDIVEFGTMTGNTAQFLAFALSGIGNNPNINHQLSKTKLYRFDSFEGLPHSEASPDQDSPHVKKGVWSPGTCKGISKEQLLEMCKEHIPESQILIYAGWFKETLPQLPDDTKFGMIHLDSDLYQSAIDVLDTCFSRGFIQEGTVIFFDDWNCNRASPKYGERRAWLEMQEKYAVDFSDWGSYGFVSYKIIVHSYSLPNGRG